MTWNLSGVGVDSLTEQALRRRIAKGAKVSLRVLNRQGVRDVEELLRAPCRQFRMIKPDAFSCAA